MKKITLLTLAFMGLTVQAQSRWTVTPRVGVNLSDLEGQSHYTTRTAFTAGAEAEYRFSPLLGLSAGAFYSMQGCNTEESMLIESPAIRLKAHTTSYALAYANVPVLLNLHLYKGLTVKGGIQLGGLLSARLKGSQTGYIDPTADQLPDGLTTITEGTQTNVKVAVGTELPDPTPDGMNHPQKIDKDMNEDAKDSFHGLDVAIPLGLSYEYKNIVLDARYHFGLTKIRDSLHNRYASITLGYRFSL